MKGLLALVAATNARLYTPRLFPPRPEPPLPPLTQEACDRQARAERRSRAIQRHVRAIGGRWLRDELLPHKCRRRYGARPALGRRPQLRAGVATRQIRAPPRGRRSDQPARAHHGRFSGRAPGLRVGTFGIDRARAVVNPSCVPTKRAYGSLLHAHLRNVLYAKATLPQPPTHVLLTAANLYWIAPGVETYIRAVGSSVYDAPRVTVPATHPPDLDPAWASIRRRLPFEGAIQQNTREASAAWDAVVRMVHTIDLNRLNHRSCFCGGFCIEDMRVAAADLFFLLEKDAARFAALSSFDAACYGGRACVVSEPAAGGGRRDDPFKGTRRCARATGFCGRSSEATSSPSSTARTTSAARGRGLVSVKSIPCGV